MPQPIGERVQNPAVPGVPTWCPCTGYPEAIPEGSPTVPGGPTAFGGRNGRNLVQEQGSPTAAPSTSSFRQSSPPQAWRPRSWPHRHMRSKFPP